MSPSLDTGPHDFTVIARHVTRPSTSREGGCRRGSGSANPRFLRPASAVNTSSIISSVANTIAGMVPTRRTMEGAVSVRRGKYDVTMNFENITDKERYFVSQWVGNLYPGKPFNVTLTLRYRFQ
jgi:outer membrane receptor protein involved in Fe transport